MVDKIPGESLASRVERDLAAVEERLKNGPAVVPVVEEPKNEKPVDSAAVLGGVVNTLIEVFYPKRIENLGSFDDPHIEAHAMICLLVLAAKKLCRSLDVEMYLYMGFGMPRGRVKPFIVSGFLTLQKAGLVELHMPDPKAALKSFRRREDGSNKYPWLISPAGANRILEAYDRITGWTLEDPEAEILKISKEACETWLKEIL